MVLSKLGREKKTGFLPRNTSIILTLVGFDLSLNTLSLFDSQNTMVFWVFLLPHKLI